MGNFGHKIRWCYMPDHLMSLSEAVSEGQVTKDQIVKIINIDKKRSLWSCFYSEP